MGCHTASLIEAFDSCLGIADLQLFPHKTMGGTVKVVIQLKVLVDVQPNLLELGILIMAIR